ncbi:hypothetical protein [Arthrobacter sp. NPDC058192]|uniref:hypothetical protein n=1 Tax=Arthrobacter sp. NPDC058192 TaxID=3346372 RepID=UPI0036E3B013
MKRLLAAIVLILAATGCSAQTQAPAAQPSTSTASATPTAAAPIVLKPGAFTFENAAGTKGALQIPGKPDAEIEKLRALAPGAPKVTYLTVHVDNRVGTVAANMYGVSIFTPAGEELKYTNADAYIDSIRPSGASADVYNQFIAAGNAHMESAKPKAVKDFVLIGPPVPTEMASITVYPTGMSNPVEAAPAS